MQLLLKVIMLMYPMTAIPTTQRNAGVLALRPWFTRLMESCDPLPSAQGYPSALTMIGRGLDQSMLSRKILRPRPQWATTA